MLSVGSLLSLSLWTLFSGDLRNTEPWRTYNNLKFNLYVFMCLDMELVEPERNIFLSNPIVLNHLRDTFSFLSQHYFTWKILSL